MNFKELKIIESTNTIIDENSVVTFIIKVKQEHYEPKMLTVRTKINGFLFTAQCLAIDFPKIKNDSLVESVSLAQPLGSY